MVSFYFNITWPVDQKAKTSKQHVQCPKKLDVYATFKIWQTKEKAKTSKKHVQYPKKPDVCETFKIWETKRHTTYAETF